MKFIAASALVLALASGTALADRYHGRSWSHHGPNTTRTWGDATRNWSGGVRVYPTQGRWIRHDGYRTQYAVARRPIFVRAPIIRQRYFDVRYQPQIIVENYAPIAGYYWVNGGWNWNGAEWQWTPGHYEPNPSYGQSAYAPSYDPAYAPSYDPAYSPSYDPAPAADDPNCDHNSY